MGRQIPAGVKAISVLFYLIVIAGIWKTADWMFRLTGIVNNEISLHYSKIAMGIYVLFSIGITVLSFLTAWGLWKAKSWSRILAFVMCSLGILYNITLMIEMPFLAFSGITVIAICVLVILYLLLNRNAVKCFQGNRSHINTGQ